MVKLANSFLTNAHLAILMKAAEIRSVIEDGASLKIMLFLSFQTLQKIAKGAILRRVIPHPKKGSLLHNSASSTKDLETPMNPTSTKQEAPNGRSNLTVDKEVLY